MTRETYCFGNGGAFDKPPCDRKTQTAIAELYPHGSEVEFRLGVKLAGERRARSLRAENQQRHNRWMSRFAPVASL